MADPRNGGPRNVGPGPFWAAVQHQAQFGLNPALVVALCWSVDRKDDCHDRIWDGQRLSIYHIISYIIRTNVLEHTRHTSALTVVQKHNETFQRNSTELKS